MLIINQKGTELYNFNTISGMWIIDETLLRDKASDRYLIKTDDYGILGGYSTKEKALKVLDMVGEFYNGTKWKMKTSVWENFVFQMPQDDEV